MISVVSELVKHRMNSDVLQAPIKALQMPNPYKSADRPFFSSGPIHLMSPSPAPRRISLPIALGLLAFLIQVAVLVGFAGSREFQPPGDDMQFYRDWAQRIAHGQWSDGKAFYGLPG